MQRIINIYTQTAFKCIADGLRDRWRDTYATICLICFIQTKQTKGEPVRRQPHRLWMQTPLRQLYPYYVHISSYIRYIYIYTYMAANEMRSKRPKRYPDADKQAENQARLKLKNNRNFISKTWHHICIRMLHNLLARDLNCLNRISLNIRLVTQKFLLREFFAAVNLFLWPSEILWTRSCFV